MVKPFQNSGFSVVKGSKVTQPPVKRMVPSLSLPISVSPLLAFCKKAYPFGVAFRRDVAFYCIYCATRATNAIPSVRAS
jgi:hypothetical protein